MRTGSWLAWGAWSACETVDVFSTPAASAEGMAFWRRDVGTGDAVQWLCGGGEWQISQAPDGHPSSVLFWRAAAQEAGRRGRLHHCAMAFDPHTVAHRTGDLDFNDHFSVHTSTTAPAKTRQSGCSEFRMASTTNSLPVCAIRDGTLRQIIHTYNHTGTRLPCKASKLAAVYLRRYGPPRGLPIWPDLFLKT